MNDARTVTITVNGKTREVSSGLNVRALLEHLGLNPELVVVERNREIVERSRYGDVAVEAGDVLELVHFVGGG